VRAGRARRRFEDAGADARAARTRLFGEGHPEDLRGEPAPGREWRVALLRLHRGSDLARRHPRPRDGAGGGAGLRGVPADARRPAR